jgi:hypothetical protein
MAKVRRESVDTYVFLSVGAFDRDELPLFAGEHKRIFEGAKA